DILVTLDQLRGVSESVEEDSILAALRERTLARDSDSDWLRQAYARTHSLSDVVRRQAERWMYGRERVIGSRR
ncbi:MAG: glutamate--cysteine ligase, partial [Aquaspirillum sp.]